MRKRSFLWKSSFEKFLGNAEKVACGLDNGVEMRYNKLHIAIRLIYFQRTDRGFSCMKSSVYFV